MSPQEAAQFVQELKPKIAIPMHYDSPKATFGPADFIAAMKGSGIKVIVLNDGESIEL